MMSFVIHGPYNCFIRRCFKHTGDIYGVWTIPDGVQATFAICHPLPSPKVDYHTKQKIYECSDILKSISKEFKKIYKVVFDAYFIIDKERFIPSISNARVVELQIKNYSGENFYFRNTKLALDASLQCDVTN